MIETLNLFNALVIENLKATWKCISKPNMGLNSEGYTTLGQKLATQDTTHLKLPNKKSLVSHSEKDEDILAEAGSQPCQEQ